LPRGMVRQRYRGESEPMRSRATQFLLSAFLLLLPFVASASLTQPALPDFADTGSEAPLFAPDAAESALLADIIDCTSIYDVRADVILVVVAVASDEPDTVHVGILWCDQRVAYWFCHIGQLPLRLAECIHCRRAGNGLCAQAYLKAQGGAVSVSDPSRHISGARYGVIDVGPDSAGLGGFTECKPCSPTGVPAGITQLDGIGLTTLDGGRSLALCRQMGAVPVAGNTPPLPNWQHSPASPRG